jgi:CheY-like chemotaxis protein
LSSPSILLVEDDPNDVALALEALRGQPFFTHVVRDGAEALEFLFCTGSRPEQHPALVLLDLRLPKRDGLDVIKILRSYHRTSRIPIIVFSGDPNRSTVEQAYELGATGYVQKPLDPQRFQEAVTEVARYWAIWNIAATPVGSAMAELLGSDAPAPHLEQHRPA